MINFAVILHNQINGYGEALNFLVNFIIRKPKT